MSTSKLYYKLSIAAFFLTFFTGIGLMLSIVLLILVIVEKKNILSQKSYLGVNQDLEYLKSAKKFSIINLILNVVLMVIAGLLLIFVFTTVLTGMSSH